MNLPDNFKKYNQVIEFYRNATNILTDHSDLCIFYCKAKNLSYSWDHKGFVKVAWKADNLTEENIYDKLSSLTDQEIENELNKFIVSNELKSVSTLTISNKFNHHIIQISEIQFRKYCSYYHDVCKDFNVKDFSIDIEFDQETANYVTETINEGQITKPNNFKSLVQYVNVIALLGVNF